MTLSFANFISKSSMKTLKRKGDKKLSCFTPLVETKQFRKKTIPKDTQINIRIKNEYEA